MRLYASMSTEFVRDTTHNRIADKLTEALVRYYRYRRSPGEIGSRRWRRRVETRTTCRLTHPPIWRDALRVTLRRSTRDWLWSMDAKRPSLHALATVTFA